MTPEESNELRRVNKVVALQALEISALKAYVEYLEQDRANGYAAWRRDSKLKNGPTPLAILHKVEAQLEKFMTKGVVI